MSFDVNLTNEIILAYTATMGYYLVFWSVLIAKKLFTAFGADV